MKRVLGGASLAMILFVGAIACRAEARWTRAAAEAHRRLATLHYDADDGLDRAATVWTRLPWPTGTSAGDVRQQRATVSYWRRQYQSLVDLTTATGSGALTDPHMMLVSANAAYRLAFTPGADRRAIVGQLDAVIQSYANVLRRDPGSLDAAYNYEYVTRVRDSLARARNAQPAKVVEKPADVAGDLPGGPTLHGVPGAPPVGTNMGEFKTLAPMRADEREQNIEADGRRDRKRKG